MAGSRIDGADVAVIIVLLVIAILFFGGIFWIDDYEDTKRMNLNKSMTESGYVKKYVEACDCVMWVKP